MKHAERIAPIAAVSTAVATLLCCLPIGFAAAAATVSVASAISQLRPWLLTVSVLLIASGFAQVYRRKSCARRSPATLAVLWISAAIIATVVLFPQVIAIVVADLLPTR